MNLSYFLLKGPFYQSPVYTTNHCALTLPLKIDDTFMKNELHTKDYLFWQDAKT